MPLPAPTTDTHSQHTPPSTAWRPIQLRECTTQLVCAKSIKHTLNPNKYTATTLDHVTNVITHIHPLWLPNMQSLSLPQAPPVFLSTFSLAIQADLPGSLDAILLLATTTFDSYFLVEQFHYKCWSISNSTIWSLSFSYLRVTLHLVHMINNEYNA